MEKKKLKFYMLLISFSVGLILMVVHFREIIYGIGFFASLLTPLFVGSMLAFVLNHPYEFFHTWYQKKWKASEKKARIFSVITVYATALGAIILIACIVFPELIRNLATFAENVEQYLTEAQLMLNRTTEKFDIEPVDLSYIIETLEQYLGTFSSALSEVLPKIMHMTSSVVSGIATAFISIVLSVYILIGKEHLFMQIRRTLRVYLPTRVYCSSRRLYRIVLQVFDDYISGQCREAIILGLLCFAGMMILRLDYAGLISVIIAVTALVPILGAYMGGAVSVLLLLFVSPGKALLFLVFLLILQQLEGAVIYPHVVGRKIGLPGMWVMLSITVWGGIFGFWGMLLGVPATTIIYQLIRGDVLSRESLSSIQK